MAAHGKVTEATLDEVWKARYDAAAQWVFVRFMLSCGVLVRAGSSKVLLEEEFILPELLPRRHTLERLLRADPLVAQTLAEGESREYLIRHRSLGQGFGCLLVGHLAQIFGRVPLYRYGGIGRIRVGIGEHSSRRHHDAVLRLEWHKEKEDAYFG